MIYSFISLPFFPDPHKFADPDPDLDPGRPKTCGSCGSGSGSETLDESISITYLAVFLDAGASQWHTSSLTPSFPPSLGPVTYAYVCHTCSIVPRPYFCRSIEPLLGPSSLQTEQPVLSGTVSSIWLLLKIGCRVAIRYSVFHDYCSRLAVELLSGTVPSIIIARDWL